MAGAFKCVLVTPEQQVFEQEISSAIIPAHDGQLGVLKGRAAMLTKLGYGALNIKLEDGQGESYFIGGGFAQVKDNVLTILTDESIPAGEVTAEEAQQALDEAQNHPKASTSEQARREKLMQRARGLQNVAKA